MNWPRSRSSNFLQCLALLNRSLNTSFIICKPFVTNIIPMFLGFISALYLKIQDRYRIESTFQFEFVHHCLI